MMVMKKLRTMATMPTYIYIYTYISVHRCGTCVLRSKNNIFIKIYITVPKIINTLHKSTITVAFKDLREISEEPEGNTLEIL